MTDASHGAPTLGDPSRASLRLPEGLRPTVEAAISRAVEERWAERLWGRDTTLWTADETVATRISRRLGWLDAPASFADRVLELTAFAEGVVAEGFERAVVCGMGGSSLAPDVLAHGFPRAAHGIPVSILDSTHPDAVRAATEASDPARTLYLIATKSGTTTETLAFLSHFWSIIHEGLGRSPSGEVGEHFVAITDPGASLEAIPHSGSFRGVFLNPPDVGGRYSALTFVGLVPGALLGLDLEGLLADADAMAERCRATDASNPGTWLGASLAALARAGRDKLTFLLEPELASLGAWLEQLIAESTGKRGTGVVPVDGEPVGKVSAYGPDRVFVRLGRSSSAAWRAATDDLVDGLASAGHPIIDLDLSHGEWLGGEFFRWEFATALCGAGLGIDPFDEPNVTESKENTRRVLERFHHDGRLPDAEPLARDGQLTLLGDAPLRLTESGGDLVGELRRHLDRARPNGYVGIHAYLAPDSSRERTLRDIQGLLRDRTARAATFGWGPRFLHSTGQLHKGGPPSGCFIQVTDTSSHDIPIPGRKESFAVLVDAQARGDFDSLEAHDLPVLRVELSGDPDAGLDELRAALDRAST